MSASDILSPKCQTSNIFCEVCCSTQILRDRFLKLLSDAFAQHLPSDPIAFTQSFCKSLLSVAKPECGNQATYLSFDGSPMESLTQECPSGEFNVFELSPDSPLRDLDPSNFITRRYRSHIFAQTEHFHDDMPQSETSLNLPSRTSVNSCSEVAQGKGTSNNASQIKCTNANSCSTASRENEFAIEKQSQKSHSEDSFSESARSCSCSPPVNDALFRRNSIVVPEEILRYRAMNEQVYPELEQTLLAIVLVGLPGRGKSYIGRRICRYLNWKGVPAAIFNAGAYRRHLAKENVSQKWFDPADAAASHERDMMAKLACDDLSSWLNKGGQVGILDATNTTSFRRADVMQWLFQRCPALEEHRILFLELICTDEKIIDNTIRKVKATGIDYKGVPKSVAYEDFRGRLRLYESKYEPLGSNDSDKDLCYIKVINSCESTQTNKIEGSLQCDLLHFVMNLRPFAPVFIAAHGVSHDTVHHRLGGNASLNQQGRDFSQRLRVFFDKTEHKELHIWTATSNRCLQTAMAFGTESHGSSSVSYTIKAWKLLEDINYGECNETSFSQIRHQKPDLYSSMCQDEYFFCWPRGESMHMLINRLEPFLLAVERNTLPLLIIASPTEECTRVKIPYSVLFEINMNSEPLGIARHII